MLTHVLTGFTGPYTLPADVESKTDHLVHLCAGSGAVPNFSIPRPAWPSSVDPPSRASIAPPPGRGERTPRRASWRALLEGARVDPQNLESRFLLARRAMRAEDFKTAARLIREIRAVEDTLGRGPQRAD